MKNNQENTEIKESNKPGKLSLAFTKIYFVSAIVSILIFTISGVFKIIKNGWTAGNIVLMSVIAANYIILLVCVIFAGNAKEAKKNYAQARKGLRIGKKSVKVTNAIAAVVVIITTHLDGFFDYIDLAFGILQSAFAVLSLLLTITNTIKNLRKKKKQEARKAAFKAKTEDIKNKAIATTQELKNKILGKKEMEELPNDTTSNDDDLEI